MTTSVPAPSVEDFDPTDPASFSFWTEDRLRYADLDMLAHVNNNAIGVFLENGRVHLFRASGRDTVGDLSWVVRRLEIDFAREITFPGTVRTGTRVAALGNSSCTLRQGIFVDGECRVTSTAVGVCFDLVGRTSVRIPDAVRAQLAAHRP